MTIQIYHGENLAEHLPLSLKFVKKFFSQPPWLYSLPDTCLISGAELIYINEPLARIFISRNTQNEADAILACIPLNSSELANNYFSPETIQKFTDKNIEITDIMYIGYFLMNEKANKKLFYDLYDALVSYTKSMHRTKISFVDHVISKNNSTNSLQTFASVEPWQEYFHDFQSTGVFHTSTWPTLQKNGGVENEEHNLEFFIKSI